jgi:hypothetical protein
VACGLWLPALCAQNVACGYAYLLSALVAPALLPYLAVSRRSALAFSFQATRTCWWARRPPAASGLMALMGTPDWRLEAGGRGADTRARQRGSAYTAYRMRGDAGLCSKPPHMPHMRTPIAAEAAAPGLPAARRIKWTPQKWQQQAALTPSLLGLFWGVPGGGRGVCGDVRSANQLCEK